MTLADDAKSRGVVQQNPVQIVCRNLELNLHTVIIQSIYIIYRSFSPSPPITQFSARSPHHYHQSHIITLTAVTSHTSLSLLSHFIHHPHCCHQSHITTTTITLHPSPSLLSSVTHHPHHITLHPSPSPLSPSHSSICFIEDHIFDGVQSQLHLNHQVQESAWSGHNANNQTRITHQHTPYRGIFTSTVLCVREQTCQDSREWRRTVPPCCLHRQPELFLNPKTF